MCVFVLLGLFFFFFLDPSWKQDSDLIGTRGDAGRLRMENVILQRPMGGLSGRIWFIPSVGPQLCLEHRYRFLWGPNQRNLGQRTHLPLCAPLGIDCPPFGSILGGDHSCRPHVSQARSQRNGWDLLCCDLHPTSDRTLTRRAWDPGRQVQTCIPAGGGR